MKRFFALVLSFLALSCQGEEEHKVIRLAHSLDESHTVHLAMKFMAKKVAKDSGGRLEIQIYPGGQLGSERETLELLQVGAVGMTKVSAAVMESFSPAYRLFGVPYLFRDREHMFRVLDGDLGKEILRSGKPQRLLGMGYYDSGSRHFYTKSKVVSPEDLKGKKIRVMNSQSSISMVNGLGAAATPLPLGDLYTALQQGVVDGAENNLPSFDKLRHYEVCKHLVLDGHTAVPDVLLLSTSVWESLSEQERSWLSEAARASVEHQRGLWHAAEAESLARVKAAGVTVHQPDHSAFAAFGTRLRSQLASDPQLFKRLSRVEATQ